MAVDDKYIGLGLAISSSIAIGTSFIITKKGLISAADNDGLSSSDNYSYLKNGLWWAGMVTMVVGEVANFAAYSFAPPILVTPLGAGSVLVGAVLASIFLGESLGRIGIAGCSLCLVGSLIIVLHAPDEKVVETVDEVLAYALQPGFLFYLCFVLAFSLWMIYKVAPTHGSSNPLVYISICSLVGSVSVMAVKGAGIAFKLTFAGNNQLWRPGTWVFAFTVVGCIAVQMNYFNKALDLFPTNVVNPSYFVGFSTCTLIASIILFGGLNTNGSNSASLLCGLYIICLGVYLLNLSRAENEGNRRHHETGILGQRMSLSTRLSMGSEGRISLPWSKRADALAFLPSPRLTFAHLVTTTRVHLSPSTSLNPLNPPNLAARSTTAPARPPLHTQSLSLAVATSDAEPFYSSQGLRDKEIGLALALTASVLIGSSIVITKKGLSQAGARSEGPAGSSYAYLKNLTWWAGTLTMAIGEVANFSAYIFAPPILVTPLGAGSVLVGAVAAAIFLDERLSQLGIIGCSLCIVGSIIIVLHSPEDKVVETVDEILGFAMQPGFLFYCAFALCFSIYVLYYVAPTYGTKTPIVYMSVSSLAGSLTVAAVKGLGVAVKMTFAGDTQLWRPASWVFAITVASMVLIQLKYLNLALDLFPVTMVNPIYFVGFSTCTLIASIILYGGLNTAGASQTLSLLAGLYVICLGVYLLNHSMSAAEAKSSSAAARRSHALERGATGDEAMFDYTREHVVLDRMEDEDDDDELPRREEDERRGMLGGRVEGGRSSWA